jgi:hypothetical protein
MIAMMRNSTTSAIANRSNTNTNLQQQPQHQKTNSEIISPLVEPRQLDQNLLELSLISQRSVLFNSFINERANDEMEVLLGSDEKEKELVMKGKDTRFYGDNGLLLSSGLTKRVRELMSSYLVIDEYMLKQSVDKAMKLDDYDPDIGQTSTCVDDIFFILKTVLKRCISTFEPEITGSTVRIILKILDNTFINQFQQKLSTIFTSPETVGAGRNTERALELAKVNYMVVLNNLDVSADYTHRLAKEVQPEIENGIWRNEEEDIKKAKENINEFEGAADKFQQILKVTILLFFISSTVMVFTLPYLYKTGWTRTTFESNVKTSYSTPLPRSLP